jgi:activated CDC42 kinase 1
MDQVQNVSQVKYVTDEDLHQIGMSRPEIRRLKKYFQKHYPSNVLAKMKKVSSIAILRN